MGNNNGLSAFPRPYSYAEDVDEVHVAQKGMSLRDYFAAKAMQSILNNLPHGIQPQDCIAAAEDAYFIADRMLEARKS